MTGIFSVQAAGELSPVQPGRGYLADGTDDYVLYDNFDGSMIGNEVTFQYRYEGIFGSKGVWGATDAEGYRYDVYLSTETSFYVFIKDSSTTKSTVYKFNFSGLTIGQIYTIKAQWIADNTIPKLWIDGEELSGAYYSVVNPSATTSKYYLYTIGANVGSTSFAGKSGLSDIQVKRSSDGKLLHSWHLDEGSGTTSFDSVKAWESENQVSNGFDFIDSNSDGLADNFHSYAQTVDPLALSIVDGAQRITTTQLLINEGNYWKSEIDSDTCSFDNFPIGSSFKMTFKGRANKTTGIQIRRGHSSVTIPIIFTDEWQEFVIEDYIVAGTNPKYIGNFTRNGNLGSVGDWFEIKDFAMVAVHDPSHGTITNATSETFHTTDTNFKSYQNDYGYSENVPSDVEVLPNSDFTVGADGLDNWINIDCSASVGNFYGRENVVEIENTNTSTIYLYDGSLVEAGKHYKVDVTYYIPEENDFYSHYIPGIRLGNTSSDLSSFTIQGEWKTDTFYKTAEVSGGFYIYTLNGVVGQKWYIADVSLKEIPPGKIPLAVTETGRILKEDIFGNNATYTGRTRTKAELVGKNVAKFDGVNDYVDLGETIELLASESWSLEVEWMQNTISDYDCILGGSGSSRLQSWTSTSAIYDVDNVNFLTLGALEAGKIYNLVMISDGSGVITANLNGTTYTSGTNLSRVFSINKIGTWLGNSNRMFDGHIRNLIIKNGDGDALYSWGLAEGAGTTVYDTVPTWYGEKMNETFSFSNWTASNATITGTNTYEYVGDNDGVYKTGILTIGKKYKGRFRGNITGDIEASRGISVDNLGTFDQYSPNITEVGDFDITFEFTALANNIYLRGYSEGGTVYVRVDEVSFQEIHDPANGTVTNADLDTFWATDMDAEDQNLVNGYTPGLINTIAGTAYIENKEAYGTWEFDVKKEGDGNIYFIGFLNSDETFSGTNNGYDIAIDANENLRLQRSTSGSRTNLLYTANSYIDLNTWYRIKVERNQTLNQYHTGAVGSFAVYIKGGDFGDDYVLVDTTGGSGTNPVVDDTYTTSAYSVVDLDAGDQVAGFMANNKIVDFHSFTEGTGAYDKLSLPAQSGRTAKDVTGNRLTYNPKDLRNSAMAYKNVAKFDGVNDYVTLGNDGKLDIPYESLTVEAWVKALDATPISNESIVSKGTGAGYNNFNLSLETNGKIRFWIGNATLTYSTDSISDNTWHHVVGVWTGTQSIVYLDGVSGTPKTNTSSITSSGAPVLVGSWNTAWNFNGSISGIRIYNRALSPVDVEKLYQGESISTSGLIAHYPLSEGAGTRVYDAAPSFYGEDMIAPLDFTTGWIAGGGVIDDSNSYSITVNNTGVYKNVLTVGKKYAYSISGTKEATVTRVGLRAWGSLDYYSTDFTSDTFNETGTFTAVTNSAFGLITYGTGQVHINKLTLKELQEPVNGTLTNTTADDFWQIDNTLPTSSLYENGFSQGLVNTTAGTAYTPSDVAYGEWEFDVKKEDTSVVDINFISSTTGDRTNSDGYLIQPYSDESLRFWRMDNEGGGTAYTSLLQSGASYISNNV